MGTYKASTCPPQGLAGLARPGFSKDGSTDPTAPPRPPLALLTAAPYHGLSHPPAREPFSPLDPVRAQGESGEARSPGGRGEHPGQCCGPGHPSGGQLPLCCPAGGPRRPGLMPASAPMVSGWLMASLGLRGLPVGCQTLRRKHSDPGCRGGRWPEGGCNGQQGPLISDQTEPRRARRSGTGSRAWVALRCWGCRAVDTETQGLPCRAGGGALQGRQRFAARSDLPRAGRGPGLPPGRAPDPRAEARPRPAQPAQHSESLRTIPPTGVCAAC